MPWNESLRRLNLRRHRPLLVAAALAVLYGFLAAGYIVLSSQIVMAISASQTQQATFEILKGLLFVGFGSASYFFLGYFLLVYVRRQDATITRQQKSLIDYESRAMAGLLAASTAHDMNNILAVSLSSLDPLINDPKLTDQQRRSVTLLSRAVENLKSLSTRLMTISEPITSQDFFEQDLSELVEETQQLASFHPALRGLTLSVKGLQPCRMRMNRSLLNRALVNLVVNAAEAAGPGGRIEIRMDYKPEQEFVTLDVHDSGPGISAENRSRVMNEFWTTKDYGRGLGLLSVRVCMKAHGGAVVVLDSELGGACFRILLNTKLLVPGIGSSATIPSIR